MGGSASYRLGKKISAAQQRGASQEEIDELERQRQAARDAERIKRADVLYIPERYRTNQVGKSNENFVESSLNNAKKGDEIQLFANDLSESAIERLRYHMREGNLKLVGKRIQESTYGGKNQQLIWDFQKVKNQRSVERMAEIVRNAENYSDVTKTILELSDLLPNPWAWGREVVEAEGNEKATRRILRQIQRSLDVDLGA